MGFRKSTAKPLLARDLCSPRDPRAHFLPRIENIEVNWAASQLDQELASGNSDGWRYAVLPQQPEALLKDLAEGFVRNGTAFLGRLSPIQDLFLKDLTAALAKILYSHPIAQESIGYTGFADGLGWSRIGVGESEVWEKSRDSVIPDSEPARPPAPIRFPAANTRQPRWSMLSSSAAVPEAHLSPPASAQPASKSS